MCYVDDLILSATWSISSMSKCKGRGLALCGSCTHIEECVSYICLLHLSSIRYLCVKGKYGGGAHVSLLV